MVTTLPASINDNARTTRCLSCLDSGESSLGHTCFANVFGIRRLDFFSSLDVLSVDVDVDADADVGPVGVSDAFELLHRYVAVVRFDAGE